MYRPHLHEDVSGKLPPERAEAALVRGGEGAIVVKELLRGRVVAAVKLELREGVERLNLLRADIVLLWPRRVQLGDAGLHSLRNSIRLNASIKDFPKIHKRVREFGSCGVL
eukprot:7256002-Pyramimonas_sp.AAC.1